jgi:hypothetical protein
LSTALAPETKGYRQLMRRDDSARIAYDFGNVKVFRMISSTFSVALDVDCRFPDSIGLIVGVDP